ncbi:PREDICTED: NADH dehydrogenase [ubiquinone] 1 alpha subcomplex subunit 2 [Ceratosolen solmsi marchali]|uniref:NADH dehydrogenase [ubiquinone] 1 alpha subcomplex subunit 2 n=1 Tax=Ceratosolen solmsi marchali TaxID=326594 RepID=A0AAJ6YVC6_9HYME|nr:PREDICTED: NADH dehydrogenase [ubiquinone] 1 alpha subcomplex subunit 2 [Ceratosolen solmsi marchali]
MLGLAICTIFSVKNILDIENIFTKMAAFKLSSKFKELRILLCQTSEASAGARQFIEQNYVSLKKVNPTLPILIRECSDTEPRLYIRAGCGKETCIPLANLNADDIVQHLKQHTAS